MDNNFDTFTITPSRREDIEIVESVRFQFGPAGYQSRFNPEAPDQPQEGSQGESEPMEVDQEAPHEEHVTEPASQPRQRRPRRRGDDLSIDMNPTHVTPSRWVRSGALPWERPITQAGPSTSVGANNLITDAGNTGSGYLAGVEMGDAEQESSAEPSRSMDDLMLETARGPAPSEENGFRFQTGDPMTGRSAAELNELFKLPKGEPVEVQGAMGKLSYKRTGDRPRAGLVQRLVDQMEKKEAKYQERLRKETESSDEKEEDDE
jgi:hypothetical protein